MTSSKEEPKTLITKILRLELKGKTNIYESRNENKLTNLLVYTWEKSVTRIYQIESLGIFCTNLSTPFIGLIQKIPLYRSSGPFLTDSHS